jgi:hypothetical protein
MYYNKKNDKESSSYVSLRKPYIAPCATSTTIEVVNLLASSGPNASYEDFKPGGDLTGDIDDQ